MMSSNKMDCSHRETLTSPSSSSNPGERGVNTCLHKKTTFQMNIHQPASPLRRAYRASKAAVNMVGKGLSVELKDKVCVGGGDTGIRGYGSTGVMTKNDELNLGLYFSSSSLEQKNAPDLQGRLSIHTTRFRST